MPLYFAYGSNMSPRQMQRRCPGAHSVGSGVLSGWQFIIPQGRGANIVPRASSKVHGALWRLTPQQLLLMDAWEGTSVGAYRRRLVGVQTDVGLKTAVTYISDKRWPGRGRPDYMLTAVLPGAAAFNLPDDYRAELMGWLAPRPIGPTSQVYVGRRTPRASARLRKPKSPAWTAIRKG